MSRASDVLALANLNKRDRYIDKSIAANFQQKRDWKWVGFDSTTGQGVVQSGNLIRRGKVITNGAIVPGEIVSYSQDGEFGIIEGKPYIRPKPQAKPQYVPRPEKINPVKIFYTLQPQQGNRKLYVGAWRPDSSEITDWTSDHPQINIGSGGASNSRLVNFDNRGDDDWMAQIWVAVNTGTNSSGFPVQNVSILECDPTSQQEILVAQGFEPQSTFPPPNNAAAQTTSGMHAISVGGGYTIVDSSKRVYTLNTAVANVTGKFQHIWQKSITEISGLPEVDDIFGTTFKSLSGKRYYMRPPAQSLKEFQANNVTPGASGWQPIATDGVETLAINKENGEVNYYLITGSQEIQLPSQNIPYVNSNFYQRAISLPHYGLKLINRVLYFVLPDQFPLDPIFGFPNYSAIQSQDTSEEGEITVRACDLMTGISTDSLVSLYKIPLGTELVSFTYHP